MKYFKKGLFLFFVGFLIQISNVSAKEIEFYFYADGGDVNTEGFSVNEYGDFITYIDAFSSSYKDSKKITHVNSINGKIFTVTKSGTSLVKGREWYYKSEFDNKVYFFSESKTYTVDGILKEVNSDNTYYSINLFPNWENKKITEGKDVTGTKPSTSTQTFSITSSISKIGVGEIVNLTVNGLSGNKNNDKISWSSSDKKIITVDSNGKIKGIKIGKATITAKTKDGAKDSITITVTETASNSVHIEYRLNGGKLAEKHGKSISVDGDSILCDGKKSCHVISSQSLLSKHGLYNYNNSSAINIERDGYIITAPDIWNTKADGTGKSYNQSTAYTSSDFCDASTKDCTVVLYANWKKKNSTHFVKIKYNINGGKLDSEHGKTISLKGDVITCDDSEICTKIEANSSLTNNGLRNYNHKTGINITRKKYTISKKAVWNTKADGTGKYFDQTTAYNASDFCDASTKDCTVVLYANWKKDSNKISFTWDDAHQVSFGGWAARLYPLPDGSIIAGYEAHGDNGNVIKTKISMNNGYSWTNEVVAASISGKNCANVNFYYYDGKLYLAYRATSGRYSSLHVSVSTDMGKSWKYHSKIIEHNGGGGYWEPFLGKVNGQLMVAYANDAVSSGGSYQYIESQQLQGSSWGDKKVLSNGRSHNSRDGMPAWTRLSNKLYVMVIESSKYTNSSGSNYHPFVIQLLYSSDGLNWSTPVDVYIPKGAGSKAAAPGIIELSTGQLVISFQTDEDSSEKGDSHSVLKTITSDGTSVESIKTSNFTKAERVFPNSAGIWGGISYKNGYIYVAGGGKGKIIYVG